MIAKNVIICTSDIYLVWW